MKIILKKTLAVFLAIVLVSLTLTGCNTVKKNNQTEIDSGKKLRVVSTIFPQYDFVRQIAGDHVQQTLLLKPGAECHSFEPTPQQIIEIQNCDVFIYVGGESDDWVKKILSSMDTKKMKVISLMDCVKAVEEEITEGMQTKNEEHEHEHEKAEKEYDEHVWTSPKNAIQIVEHISKALCELDIKHQETYVNNTNSYIKKLTQLDENFQQIVSHAKRKTIVFGDRFPFRYFVDAYGLKYFAAYPGCSTDTGESASTVAFLVQKVKDEKIPVVFHIELSNESMTNMICEATGAKKALLHACHNISKSDFENGETYLSLMQKNAKNLQEALS